MRKQTSRWSAAAAGVLLVSLLGGCVGMNAGSQSAATGSDSDAKDGTVKLTMWGGVPPENGPQEVVDDWNAEHPDIQVEYVRYVNDDDGNLKLDTALSTGQNVDLFVNYAMSNLDKRTKSGVALDMAEFTDYDIDKTMGEEAASWKIDGKYYGLPTTRNATFFALNADALDKAGLPVPQEWTWEEARQYASKLKQSGFQYGLVQHTATFSDPLDSAMVADGYTKQDGSSNMDDPLVATWLETLNAMMTEDASTPPLGEQLTSKMPVENLFLGGDAAMLNIGGWLLRSSNNQTDFPRDFKIAFAPVPRLMENEADYSTSGGVGDLISINAKSAHKDEAWQFLKWYADGGMLPMAPGGRIPASNAADRDEAIKRMLDGQDETYDKESLEYVLFGNDTPTFTRELSQEMVDMRAQEYEKYFLGDQTLEQTMQKMVKLHNAWLAKNK
ncbi:extracellular solute-binding protein [Saccharibacillus sp. CPCC 101409]|uniref:ABC transporter substrate-binding protein n=1 Tax=Saccharibacillus sp. CPCC 101409 TaxID=3058041 RepID=UPI0026720E5F|nr:extracellular solute-binding protein [Saccharibacillus sp. CPCC 101409]MDO3411186.1 extracellular solute-binding protein [Saccharibacillus sp. CPCC 101409]